MRDVVVVCGSSSSRTFQAARWEVTEHGDLHLLDQRAQFVASFAAGFWLQVGFDEDEA